MLITKYKLYQIFLNSIRYNKKIFVYGNSQNSGDIIEMLQKYNLETLVFSKEEKTEENLGLSLNAYKNGLERFGNSYKLFYNPRYSNSDIIYLIISAYIAAKRSVR